MQDSRNQSETVLTFSISCLLNENVDVAETGCHIASNILRHDKVCHMFIQFPSNLGVCVCVCFSYPAVFERCSGYLFVQF